MDTATLQHLGLKKVGTSGESLEVALTLRKPLVNPLNQRPLDTVTFSVVEGRLVPLSPPETVGLTPLLIGPLPRSSGLDAELRLAFELSVSQVMRASSELQALGLHASMDPETLVLSTVVAEQGLEVTLVADRMGHFHITQATRDGQPVPVPDTQAPFELSEFRERAALVGYLAALFGETAPAQSAEPESEHLVRFSDLLGAFGPGMVLPPRSNVELLMMLEVEGKAYRFAAARVAGRTFRGLLAGPRGKLWAERFELEDFPGVVPLLATLLGVPTEAVHVVHRDPEEEA